MKDIALNSLGFAKAPADTRVVVAMSGGVDSSVVAAMLKDEGYDVVGVTLQLYDHGAALAKKGACCAGQDIHDARRVAETLGEEHRSPVLVVEDDGVAHPERRRPDAKVDDDVEDGAGTHDADGPALPCLFDRQRLKGWTREATSMDGSRHRTGDRGCFLRWW